MKNTNEYFVNFTKFVLNDRCLTCSWVLNSYFKVKIYQNVNYCVSIALELIKWLLNITIISYTDFCEFVLRVDIYINYQFTYLLCVYNWYVYMFFISKLLDLQKFARSYAFFPMFLIEVYNSTTMKITKMPDLVMFLSHLWLKIN